MKDNHSLAIVGGGPVGLGLALFLAKKGHYVTVFEQGAYPRDKACGQGIMPKGQALLSELLQIDLKEIGYYFSGIDYIDQDLILSGKLAYPGIGIERRVLSEHLYNKVKSNQLIHLRENTSVSLQSNNQSVLLHDGTESIRFDYIFACDGIHSPLRKALGMQKKRRGPLRQGARVHFRQAPWCDHVQVYWHDGVEAYVTPVGENRLEVAFLWYKDSLSQDKLPLQEKLFSYFPKLCKRLDFNQIDGDFKGSAPFSYVAKKSRSKNVFFVGDSYGFLDGITGEGISLGLDQARFISEYFSSWGIIPRIRYRLKFYHYWIMVHLALILSRHLRLRAFILKVTPSSVFSHILRLNDL